MPRLATPLPKPPTDVDAFEAGASFGRKTLVWAFAGTLTVLVGAQLLLPMIATKILRRQVGEDGTVLSADIHAFPAIQLAWGRASSVRLRLATYKVRVDKITSLLDQSFDSDRLDVGIDELVITTGSQGTQLLTLRHVSFSKRGTRLEGTAQVDNADLRRVLPFVQSVTAVASADGKLTLQGAADLLGGRVTIEAALEARDGKLVVIPSGVLGSVAAVTVYASPEIYVESVAGHSTAGGMAVTVTGRQR